MSKSSFKLNPVIVVIIAVVCLFGGMYISVHNSLVKRDQQVESKMSQIDNQLQRRADLVPNLVNTVKGYASHEEKIYTALADARANMNKASTVQEKADADQQLSTAIKSLSIVVENYPNLKANENFRDLQTQLEGTENRITVARKDYNDAVQGFNTYKKTFPASIFSGGYKDKEYFKAKEGAEKTPTVDFSK